MKPLSRRRKSLQPRTTSAAPSTIAPPPSAPRRLSVITTRPRKPKTRKPGRAEAPPCENGCRREAGEGGASPPGSRSPRTASSASGRKGRSPATPAEKPSPPRRGRRRRRRASAGRRRCDRRARARARGAPSRQRAPRREDLVRHLRDAEAEVDEQRRRHRRHRGAPRPRSARRSMSAGDDEQGGEFQVIVRLDLRTERLEACDRMCCAGIHERPVVDAPERARRDVDDRDETGDVRRRRGEETVIAATDDPDSVELVVVARAAARRELEDDAHPAPVAIAAFRCSSVPISGLTGGMPPMCEFRSAPRTSSAKAMLWLVVGPKPGRMRPTAPRRASVAKAASLIRSTMTTWNGAGGGETRADAVPGTASAATAAEATARRRKRRERRTKGSPILTYRPGELSDPYALLVDPCRLLLEELLEARRALEGAEPGGTLESLVPEAPEPPPAARGRNRSRRADEAAEKEIQRSSAPAVRLHGTIVPCASEPSGTCCST